MGYKQYLAVGQSARNRLFGLAPRISGDKRTLPLNMMISQQGKINHGTKAHRYRGEREAWVEGAGLLDVPIYRSAGLVR
ncbi:hypothetical protein RR48_08631 [Papilio machaon]|uniref:Uncharacterized protein n=1 Tax=Papilio machaon TaxID=76193 RepID=A0A194RJC9_PAPMA|nr:hypothetical protein RR48_08631 [Papilio machaon]